MKRPEPVRYSCQFSDLPIRAGLLEKQLGYEEGNAPEPISGIIREILEKAPFYADIRGGYVILDHFELREKSRIIIDKVDFNAGKIITGSLRKSEKLAFFLMTAGSGIEDWSKEMSSSGDPLAGYIIDLLGSETVEAAMDLMQEKIEAEMGKMGFRISNRYSPGYCGWLVREQQKLFALFPDRFCDIRLSPSSLMIPIKSVSGVIGIGRDVKKMAYMCQVCDMKDCIYRNRSGR